VSVLLLHGETVDVSCFAYVFKPEDAICIFLRNVGWLRSTHHYIPEGNALSTELVTLWPIHSMEQSRSSEADSCSASQELSILLWIPNFCYRLYDRPSIVIIVIIVGMCNLCPHNKGRMERITRWGALVYFSVVIPCLDCSLTLKMDAVHVSET
jgi:hypothetical protein